MAEREIVSPFRELTLALLEEGNFQKDVDEKLVNLSRELLKYVETWGDQANKAKATLSLKVELICINADQQMFAIKTSIESKQPSRPAYASVAMAAPSEDDGKMSLFVRASGSSSDHPHQKKLCTSDGREIDPVTGIPKT